MLILQTDPKSGFDGLRLELGQGHDGCSPYLPTVIAVGGVKDSVEGSRVVLPSRHQAGHGLVTDPPVDISDALQELLRRMEGLRFLRATDQEARWASNLGSSSSMIGIGPMGPIQISSGWSSGG
jgi:hypothetical protein